MPSCDVQREVGVTSKPAVSGACFTLRAYFGVIFRFLRQNSVISFK